MLRGCDQGGGCLLSALQLPTEWLSTGPLCPAQCPFHHGPVPGMVLGHWVMWSGVTGYWSNHHRLSCSLSGPGQVLGPLSLLSVCSTLRLGWHETLSWGGHWSPAISFWYSGGRSEWMITVKMIQNRSVWAQSKEFIWLVCVIMI